MLRVDSIINKVKDVAWKLEDLKGLVDEEEALLEGITP